MRIRRTKQGIKRPLIDEIQFDSGEEGDIYKSLRDGKIYKDTGIEELKGAKLISAKPSSIELYPKFTRGLFNIRARKYTSDFVIKKSDGTEVLLEYKSCFTEKKPDYRLRRTIFLLIHGMKYNFAELIKVRKGVYLYKEYF